MDNFILLCSGGLGEIALRHIYDRRKLTYVFTDKSSVSIINFCKSNNIQFYAGNPRKESAKPIIKSLQCSVLLSVNYLFIVEADLLAVACDYSINFHGSLLPKYRGRTPHVWAIINGEKETGVTAHLMTDEVDNGKILKQLSMPIEEDDTGFTILNKFNNLYPDIINEVLSDLDNGQIYLREQDHEKATYFGKRTPEDGEINWDWQKERIRNWVRAQAAPYPGAFTFYEGEKVIIHDISYEDVGFCYNDPNGMILKSDPVPVIKTPNGAVGLSKIESSSSLNFQKGKLLCGKL